MLLIETACMVVLALCLLPCIYRIVAGPHVLDRLLAFDLVGVLILVAVAVFAITQDSWAYLEVSMGLAILAFVGTMAIAHYIDRERAA